MRRIGLAALGLVALVPRPGPAEAPPEVAPPSFAASAELVTVDALVLDRDGKPVSGLGRGDFRVLEDGQPQPITAFEAVEAKLPPRPAEEKAPPPSATRFETNLSGAPTRRTFGIVFDDLHLGSLNAGRARKALEAFLTREARPGDRLVLVTTSNGRFWTSTRGADSRRFAEALDAVVSKQRAALPPDLGMSPVEAMRIAAFGEYDVAARVRRRRAILSGTCVWTVGRCECQSRDPSAGRRGRISLAAAADDGCQEPPGAESAEEAYTDAVASAERSLRVVRESIAALGARRDRKVLVLVSEGFLLDPSVGGFRQVRDSAARANVVLYFLDVRGLVTAPEYLSVSGFAGSLPSRDLTAAMADWRREADGPRELAEDTGGLTLQSNDLLGALEKIAAESRVTYLIGFEPASSARDGKYHTLKVEVLRPGLRVRARAGYWAPSGERVSSAEAKDPVARALRDPFDADGIPLRLAAYVLGRTRQTKHPRFEVLVVGELRSDALETRSESGRRVATAQLTLLSESPGGEWHRSVWTESVDPARAASGDAWQPFLTRVALRPGDQRLRLVARSGERTGSLTVDLVVPKPGAERLSTPILSDRLALEGEERRVVPLVRRTFASSGTLHCWVELYGARPDRATGRPRLSARFQARSASGEEWAGGPLPALAKGDGSARLVNIPLGQAPLGENDLLLVVRDELSGRSFEAREPFRVEGEDAGPGER